MYVCIEILDPLLVSRGRFLEYQFQGCRGTEQQVCRCCYCRSCSLVAMNEIELLY